jgi:uncharacterized membrane protein YphA (DoxX/SURF4 family)
VVNTWAALRFLVRICLAGLLLYACYDKLVSPRSFIDAVDNYRFVPEVALNFVGIVVPWLELVTGLCLLLGIAQRAAFLVALFSLHRTRLLSQQGSFVD